MQKGSILMRKIMLTCLVVSALLGAVTLAPAEAVGQVNQKNLVTVTVLGEGMSKADAMRDGQRKAIEQAAGTLIYSQSQTKDFALVRDTVLARAAGFIQECKVLSGGSGPADDGTWALKLRCVVSKKGIEDTWGVVTNLLKQMGRPKIMVFLRERIDENWQDVPTVQTRVENLLLKSGFLLVDKNQIKEIDRRDLQSAMAEDKPGLVAAIAKRFGAQIFVTGQATATKDADYPKQLYGRMRHKYWGEANVKTFRADTGQLISSIPGKSFPGVQGSARGAAKQALDAEGRFIAPRITNNILRFWMDAMEGRGEIQLKVSGIKYLEYTRLKKALAKLKEVKDVRAKFASGNADISIEADCTAESLAEKIAEQMEDKLEISDVSQNVIKATFVKGN